MLNARSVSQLKCWTSSIEALKHCSMHSGIMVTDAELASMKNATKYPKLYLQIVNRYPFGSPPTLFVRDVFTIFTSGQ